MSASLAAAAAPRHRPPVSLLPVLGKLLFGVAIFAAVLTGWGEVQRWRAMHVPLPGADGPQGACSIWFIGSSSFAKWTTLAPDMRPWITHNRGVLGAKIDEIDQRFANEPDQVPPSAIVFYAGENDIANGESTAGVIADFRRFLAIKEQRMPRVPMLAVSLKPTPTRWSMRPQQAAYNAAMASVAARDPMLTYVDIVPLMLVNGRPGPFFVPDGIHMKPDGYRRWSDRIRAALVQVLPPAIVHRCGRPAQA